MLQTAKEHGFIFDAVQMPLNVMDAQFWKASKKRFWPGINGKIISVPLRWKSIGNNIFLKSNVVIAKGVSSLYNELTPSVRS